MRAQGPQRTGEGLFTKGNKGSARKQLANYQVAKNSRYPSLKPTESLPLHSALALPCHQLDFNMRKMVEQLRESKTGEDPITGLQVQQPLTGESWNYFHFLENLNSSFIQARNLGDTQMPPFSFFFPSNQIGHQFLSFYPLNISHLYTFQTSSLLFAQDQSLLLHSLASRLLLPISPKLQPEGSLGNPNLVMSLPLRGFHCIWESPGTHTGPLDQSPAYFFRLLPSFSFLYNFHMMFLEAPLVLIVCFEGVDIKELSSPTAQILRD